MVYHGVENKLGVLIALGYALLNFLSVVSAQVGDEPCLARYFLQKLLLGIFAAETKAYEVGRRQRTGPLGRERTLAVEGVVGVDGSSVVVRGDGNTPAQVADNEVQVFITLAYLHGKSAGNGPLVQGVPYTNTGHDGRSADAGRWQ